MTFLNLAMCLSTDKSNIVQDRQFTYNRTLRHVCATVVTIEKQYVLHILNVSVALVIQHALHIHHILSCHLSGSTTFFNIISQMA